MPHIIIEHSSNFSSNEVENLFVDLQKAMASIKEGNFDLEQCKARAISFDDYLVGSLNQDKSTFLHVTIKIMAGRSVEVRKKLAQQAMVSVQRSYENAAFSPNNTDQILAIGEQVADMITGTPNAAMPMQNSDLVDRRCDLSVDIVEMDRETYQKARIGE